MGKMIILSEKSVIITDQEKNKIFLDSFEYLTKSNIFKSIGYNLKLKILKIIFMNFRKYILIQKKR